MNNSLPKSANGPADTPLNLWRELDDGLILRPATKADAKAVAAFNKRIHYENLGVSVGDLMTHNNPIISAADFLIVSDPKADDKIVASTALFSDTWRYEDIPFGVGKIECVGTDPDYRRRGLMRALFKANHQLSAAHSHLVQAVSGIRYFYRAFGYEYALDEPGTRQFRLTDVPKLPEDQTEPYQIRPATLDDIPVLELLYKSYGNGRLITKTRSHTRWCYQINDNSQGAIAVTHFSILNATGKVVGYYSTWGDRPWGGLIIRELAVAASVSIYNVLPTLLRTIKAFTVTYGNQFQDSQPTHIHFTLGQEHPINEVLGVELEAYEAAAWYIRVQNLLQFLAHIAPVLERRLAQSAMSGFTGNMPISFYGSGLRFTFEQGKIAKVTDWQPQFEDEPCHVSFPPLVFLKLLFGYRSLAELRYAYPDCWANKEGTLLLNALFPKKPSWAPW